MIRFYLYEIRNHLFFLKTFHLNLFRLLLLFFLSGTFLSSNAMESFWYKDKESQKNNGLAVSPVPSGYMDPFIMDPCASRTYDKLLSLIDITEAALCNNPQTKEVYATAKVRAAEAGIARSLFFPSITNSSTLNRSKDQPELTNRPINPYTKFSNSLVLSYLLYDFGSRDSNLENAYQILNAASATQNATVQSVLLAAVNAFYQVQANKALLDASIESEHLNEESFKAAEARYIAGVATPADKLQAQTAFANASLTRLKNEGMVKIAYGNLANLMGISANTPIQIIDIKNGSSASAIDQDIQQLIEQAHLKRPDLIASEAQVKASKAKIEMTKADSKPTINLNLSNTQSNDTNFTDVNTSSIGLSVTIPLFSGYKPTYLIRSAEATAELMASQRDQLKLQISLDVWTAYQNLKTANESIQASDILVKSAEESSRVALGIYKEGIGNIIDTLNAQSALANARSQKIQAYLNWSIAKTTLAQSMGVLDYSMIETLPEAKK